MHFTLVYIICYLMKKTRNFIRDQEQFSGEKKLTIACIISESYAKARQKLTCAEVESDIQTVDEETDEEIIVRHSKRMKRYFS